MAARTQVRPKLAIDLGEQVSKDLLIKPITTHGIAIASGISASSGIKAAGGITAPRAIAAPQALQIKGPVSTHQRSAVRAKGAAISHKPPLNLVEALRARIANVLPPDGDVCFTITHDFGGLRVGEPWRNWNESYFWLGSAGQLSYAVDEWMNAEYEWVCDSFYDRDERIGHPTHPGYFLAPDSELLLSAWDAVASGNEENFLVPVQNKDGIPVSHEMVPAEEIMSWFGVDRTTIMPIVVIADQLLPADLVRIERNEEVTLDDGNYVVTAADLSDEVAVMHIQPKGN